MDRTSLSGQPFLRTFFLSWGWPHHTCRDSAELASSQMMFAIENGLEALFFGTMLSSGRSISIIFLCRSYQDLQGSTCYEDVDI